MTLGRPDNIGVISTQDFTAGEDNIIGPMQRMWPDGVIDKYLADKHRLVLSNGHKIRFISGENPDSAKGLSKVAYYGIDEAVLQPAWVQKVMRGRVIDLMAPGIVTTTPSGKERGKPTQGLKWVKDLYNRGVNPKYGDVQYDEDSEKIVVGNPDVPWGQRHFSWNMSTWDNPYLPIEEREALLDDYSQDEYSSEILGRFTDQPLEVFHDHHFDPDKVGYLEEELKGYHLEYAMIIDPAWSVEKKNKGCESAILVVGVGPDDEHGRLGLFIIESWAGHVEPYDLELTIMQKALQYDIRKAGCEKVGADTLIDNLKRAQTIENTFQVISLGTKNQDKRTRASGVPAYLENRLLKLPIDSSGNFINGTDKLIEQALLFTGGKKEASDRVDTLAYIFHPDMGLMKGIKKEDYRRPAAMVDTVMRPDDFRKIERSGKIAAMQKKIRPAVALMDARGSRAGLV